MSLKDITITSSIGSYPTLSYGQKTYIPSTDEQSFPIETIFVGTGGSLPDLKGNISSSNLFVNIVQSWSGSVNTPVGIVEFIDSTQNEFINGQYSGSTMLISNGNLSENNPFLEPSINANTYTPTFYFGDSGSYVNTIPLNNFLNTSTVPNSGEMFFYFEDDDKTNPFVQTPQSYVKIALIDGDGDNKITTLRQLQYIRINYSNGINIQYTIIDRTEYNTCFLFKLNAYTSPNNYTVENQLDGKILNYAISASNSSSFTVSVDSLTTASFTTTTTNPLGYFNSSTGIYTLNNTPNKILHFTASFTTDNQGSVALTRDPFNTGIGIAVKSFGGSGNYVLSGSFTPIQNETYALIFVGDDTNPYDITNLQFKVTQSQAVPQSGILELVYFSPDFSQDFEYNDYNALYGNASGLEYNQDFMKVDYETGIIPTNQTQIISGTAEYAPVKKYNYALRAQILPRYEGVRTTQQSENIWTQGDIGYSNTPTVKNLQTYFAYFDKLQDTTPILTNKMAAHIKYLIDEDGEVIVPAGLTSPYYYTLIDNFESNKNNNIILNSSSGDVSIFGMRRTIRSGVYPNPIIASQTGSDSVNYNVQPTMSFGTSGSNIPDYNSVYLGTANQVLNPYPFIPSQYASNTVSYIFKIASSVYANNTSFQTDSGGYQSGSIQVDLNSNLTQIAFQFDFTAYFKSLGTSPFNFYYGTNSTYRGITPYLLMSTDDGNTYTQVGPFSTQYPIQNSATQSFTFTSPYFTPQDTYKYQIYLEYGYGNYNFKIASSTVRVLQNPATSISEVLSSPYYFTTGSVPGRDRVLTGSFMMSQLYNPINPFTQQNDVGDFLNSGYSKFLPFSIQPGDEIRFEGDENQVFGIVSTTYTDYTLPVPMSMSILLNNPIPATTDINSFLIRRNTLNSSFMIVDSDLLTYNGSDGFIVPEFSTPMLKDNFNKNILKLKDKGLIP